VHRSRRPALAAGFGAMLVLQIFSTVEAYRIQSTVSEQHLEIYKRYTERDEALSHLRRNVLLDPTGPATSSEHAPRIASR